jgi:heme/copper-type cytochrome/quinol oxidase subunit 2
MKNKIFLVLLLLLIFVTACYHTPEEAIPSSEVPGLEDVKETVVAPGSEESSIKEIEVIAKQWSFEPDPIRVKKGDLVRLHIKSIDVDHGFALPDLKLMKN